MKHEREIDLRDLLYYVLKKWRVIIIVGLIIALLAGACKCISGISNNTSPSDIPVEDADDLTREKLARDVEDLQKKLDDQKEYNENSVLMKTDPLQKYVAAFVVYADSDYQIDPNLTYQSADISGVLKVTYRAFFESEELYAYIFENTDCNEDIDGQSTYLSELISVAVESDNPVLTVKISGDTPERVHQIAEATKQAVKNKYPEIASAIGEHSCNILMESEYSVVDHALEDTQINNLNLIDDYELNLATKTAQLEATAAPSAVPEKLSMRQIAVSAVKSAIIGGVIGVIIAAAGCFVMALQSRKMWSAASWESFEIPVFGEVHAEKKHKAGEKLDKLIDKLGGYSQADISPEDAGKLAAVNVAASLEDKVGSPVAVISAADKALCSSFVAGMNKQADVFFFAGDLLSDPEAVSGISERETVVLLADGEKITTDEVSRILMLLSVWGKKLLGVILIK